MSNNVAQIRRTEYAAAHAPSELDVVPAEWNVLPRTATRDEIDVHWFFNWAEGDMMPRPQLNPWERATIGKRVHTNDRKDAVDFPGVRRAATRSSHVRSVLVALSPQQVSALARWAAPPVRYRDAVRARFGRLSAVAALTEGFEEIGGTEEFYRACERAQSPRSTDGTENFLRHAAKVKLAVIEEQAQALLAEAFTAYAAERANVRAEDARAVAHRRRVREPGMTTVLDAANTNGADDEAVAGLLADQPL
ncbi:MAG: hypothetical protein HYV09_03485 [Deltaproteobacteria bacterium]|nr:hypothetical protein [Deltaproteobacteria bacterium]